jgi:hypothetical protein
MSSMVKDNTGAHIEDHCAIEHNGQSFESGGSYLLRRKDTGKLEGMLYRQPNGMIGTWDSLQLVKATWGLPFMTNLGVKAQYCWFTWEGKRFIGRNNSIEWQDIVRVREIK